MIFGNSLAQLPDGEQHPAAEEAPAADTADEKMDGKSRKCSVNSVETKQTQSLKITSCTAGQLQYLIIHLSLDVSAEQSYSKKRNHAVEGGNAILSVSILPSRTRVPTSAAAALWGQCL